MENKTKTVEDSKVRLYKVWLSDDHFNYFLTNNPIKIINIYGDDFCKIEKLGKVKVHKNDSFKSVD